MRAFLATFTASVLFAHAVLGCCAHHAHACGESHGAIELVDGNQPGPDACGDHSAGGSEPTSHKHQGQDECQGSTCDFGRPANEREVESCHLSCQAAAVLPSEIPPVLTGVHLEHGVCATGVLPPVRLYLVHQILLI